MLVMVEDSGAGLVKEILSHIEVMVMVPPCEYQQQDGFIIPLKKPERWQERLRM